MAEAAVEFLLKNFRDLLIYHSHLITATKSEIENLEKDLHLFNEFLNRPRTKAMDRKIREAVYEVEDVIDTFVTHVLQKNSTSSCLKFGKYTLDLHALGEIVQEVKMKVERVKDDMASFNSPDEASASPEDRQPRQTDLEGFDDVTAKLVHRLTTQTDHFDVVCLIGSFGIGKTTLAWRIFIHEEILKVFPEKRRIWLLNHHNFSEKEIFLDMLKQLTGTDDNDRCKKEEKQIIRDLVDLLRSESFLIVMDDAWSTADWERLRKVLSISNNKGKVLITTRIVEVGKYACGRKGLPYYLRQFNQEECWKLLRKEALRDLDCPPEFMSVGQVIASRCDGLPHAIVIIGRILAKKYSTKEGWDEVARKVSVLLNEEQDMNRSISLSFDELPSHLRTCFVYLGTMFPKGHEIPVSKLIQMWIGEGFIPQIKDCTLEDTGEKYLEDLINRSMVIAQTVKMNGKVKTCRIHDVVREFCLTKAGKENFFHEIESMNNASEDALTKCRHLFVHSNCLNLINAKSSATRVRSFVCFSEDDYILPLEKIPDIVKAFKLVRVFDAKPIKFPKVKSDLFQLIHIRYITLSFNLSSLPSKFSHLLNLQTLIVDTTSKTLKVEADIWKLIQLRHFKTNASALLPKPSKDSKNAAELQTLGTISVESCMEELPEQAFNLKKLGIRGQLALLLEGKKGSFDNIGKMKNLENLKLINELHANKRFDGKLSTLPQPRQFPSMLKSLTLRATFLGWNNMSTLGLLENLQVLKLKDKAFMGEIWDTDADAGFLRLEFLHIKDTNLKVWASSSVHYPKLKGLVLRKCTELLAVPIELAEIKTFQALQLYSCKSDAVTSAKSIQEAKKKSLHPPFSLLINEQS